MALRSISWVLVAACAGSIACTGGDRSEIVESIDPSRPTKSSPLPEPAAERTSSYTASLVVDINRRLAPGVGAAAAWRGWVYFAGDDGVHGQELMRTDGQRVELVRDVRPGALGSRISQIVAGPERIYFLADDGASGREIWSSDGTSAGTSLLLETRQGPEGIELSELPFTVRGADVYFAAPTRGYWPDRVFKTSGSGAAEIYALAEDQQVTALAATTRAVFAVVDSDARELIAIERGGSAVHLARHAREWFGAASLRDNLAHVDVVGDRVVYAAGDDVHGAELYASDGTVEGTGPVLELGQGPLSGLTGASRATVGARHFFFGPGAGVLGVGLFSTDGTAEGTTRVDDVDRAGELVAAGGALYALTSKAGVRGLYKSDGGALALVTGIDGDARAPVAAGDRVLFRVARSSRLETWISDGTAPGTSPLAALGGDADARPLGAIGGAVLLAANDDVGDAQLWSTDGTKAGTAPLARLSNATASARPEGVTAGAGGKAFFRADDGAGPQIWASDGTHRGTVRLTSGASDDASPFEIATMGAYTYFTHGGDVWESDGSTRGTRRVTTSAARVPSVAASLGAVYYTSARGVVRTDGVSVREVAVSRDPYAPVVPSARGVLVKTETGVASIDDARVTSILDAAGSGRVLGGVLAGGRTVFGLSTYSEASGVYATDGTKAGTVRLVASAAPYTDAPRAFAELGDRALFVAGDALYVTDGTEDGTARLLDDVARVAHPLATLRGSVYALVRGVDGGALWVSDGTTRGTRWLVDRAGGDGSGVIAYAERAFFARRAASGDVQILSVDGSGEPARVEVSRVPGAAGSMPSEWTVLGPRLLFAADDASRGRELFSLVPSAP
jgi:ELWxxDGT repeat protein